MREGSRMKKMNKTVYLLRHCQATGQEPEAELTEKGKEQAEEIAHFFDNQSIEHIISSPFTRAIQSIEPTANKLGLQITVDHRLIERQLVPPKITDWLERIAESIEEKDVKMATGESSREVLLSMMEVLEAAPDGTVISTHGNIIRLVLKQVDGLYGVKEWTGVSHPDIYELKMKKGDCDIKRIWD